jgi:anaerobic selenocysteine-containing dehydrogenase
MAETPSTGPELRCATCGAVLYEGAEWCSMCFSPVRAQRASEPTRGHDADPEPARPTAERPLLLMAFSTEKAQSSQWAHPHGQEGPAVATVHPDAAAGLADGALARVESEVGGMEVRLRFDARQRRDVVLMAKGGWLRDGRCANTLVPARLTDAGGGAVLYDTPVRIARR